MRFTVFHIVIFLAALPDVIQPVKFRSPHIVLEKPHTEFDPGSATIHEVKARKGGIELRCEKDKQETLPDTDISGYTWLKRLHSAIIPSTKYMIKEKDSIYEYLCRIIAKDRIKSSDYSYHVTITVVEGGSPLGSHPEVSDYTSTSVDVSWKKPDTTDTFTDYYIKISPIYSKETASAVKGDEENPKTHLTNLKPWTSYEVTVRTRTVLDGDDYYGPEKKQSFMTKDAANQKERSLVSIVTCFILSLCVTF